MSADGDTVRKALDYGGDYLPHSGIRNAGLAALARLEAAEAMARAEQERAHVLEHERDWEQEVVNADLWNRLNAAEAQRDALAEGIGEYLLWRPGEKGHAEAHRRLHAALAEAGLAK